MSDLFSYHQSSDIFAGFEKESETVPVRPAVKLALRYTDGTYLHVLGDRPLENGGILNFPGGGIKKLETPSGINVWETSGQALGREMDEEVDGWPVGIGDVQYLGNVEGIVTTRHGEVKLARWVLFGVCNVARPTDDKIKKFRQRPFFFSPEQSLASGLVSSNVKGSIELAEAHFNKLR